MGKGMGASSFFLLIIYIFLIYSFPGFYTFISNNRVKRSTAYLVTVIQSSNILFQ